MSDTTHIDHPKKAPTYIAHTVRDAGDGKSYWNRVGVAWTNRSGKGLVVQLEAVPLDGRIVLVPPTKE
ncbi:hypothetical protein GobsT_14040 [Gemmata obscuriglobus]|uniref:Uncharacterized protein n=1 Tax=Gemmata obscuriglobus TaxID=114 RepID=A0A2Z3H061_9BACT|nr:hypothetical protein [Gemmata obscuriglobus]AWM40159.1 hypothetical protein C1280_26250 [Gemmata obscuriglobus]QEG26659.1 hypothetical protein GobsT_14040 [Gemmata obscuriglobus]VTS02265.1 Uncharacterized protein OS=Blastopirellula marina DSM 3645 GN=DSM3645_27967 PE=4 SV=1 [Gemmata obscuriglobus UQM 2246]